uniref:Exocyst complex component EXOC6/Sec15 N-terminal domain-containing protein n=3 Tax=Phlebotomus papatasi TaxID=29031 RepID=A0A1B0DDY8_PHLPP
MANVSIQDIESVDDYWGPTFRSILEGTDQASLCEQIDARIRNHDKDIERICNIYYQGFIESIRELLQVRTQTKNLNNEVLSLNESLGEVSSGLLTRGKELVRARQVEGNIANAIQSLTNCLPVLECFSKLLRQVNEKRYYPALKTLEQLENEHLPKVANYRFTAQMKSAVPKLKEKIKQSSEEDFREFLENIRKFSPKIGEVAMNHTRQMQRRNLKSIIEEYQSMEKNGSAVDEEDLSAQ